MNVKERLISAMEALGFVQGETLFLQGTLGADESYPANFVTFFVRSVDDDAHYNNDTCRYRWLVTVCYYANKAQLVNTVPSAIRAELKANGFIPQGKGQDAISDEKTHTGWLMNFLYAEYE